MYHKLVFTTFEVFAPASISLNVLLEVILIDDKTNFYSLQNQLILIELQVNI